MRRLGSIIALAAFVVTAALVTLLVLAYGVEQRMPSEVRIAALDAPVRIGWDDGTPIIDADDAAGMYAALGFVHGAQRGWAASLWRQTATAGLAGWFGSELAEVDSIALQLGLARSARDAFRMLPAEDQRLLRAYADGMNRALSRRSIRLQDEFAVLGVEPDAWEPWHALAVERLFAFLAIEPVADTLGADALPEYALFRSRAERMRAFLAAGNHHHSAAWVSAESGQRRLYARFVHGASTEPYLHEQTLVIDGDTVHVASVPGAPLFPVGAAPGRAWAILPVSRAAVTMDLADTLQIPLVHDRLVDRDGAEYLVSFRRSAAGLEIGHGFTLVPGDTAGAFIERRASYRVVWPGFGAGSDLPSWRALLHGDSPVFLLLEGAGLVVTPSDVYRTGASESAYATSGGVLTAGPPEWVARLAQSLSRDRGGEEEELASPFDDTFSAWAGTVGPPMIAAARSIPEPPRAVRDALTYLRNWDYRYDESSIAATVFDVWVGRYLDEGGILPDAAIDDTSFTERFLRYRTLAETVDYLTERFGGTMSQWRWENAMLDERYAPGWPPASRFDDAATNRRFPVVDLPGRGHPSAAAYGPSPLDGFGQGSAVWEGILAPGSQMEVRRRVINLRSFLGRYMVTDRPPEFETPGRGQPSRVTTLTP